jgi:hypothetical protein
MQYHEMNKIWYKLLEKIIHLKIKKFLICYVMENITKMGYILIFK